MNGPIVVRQVCADVPVSWPVLDADRSGFQEYFQQLLLDTPGLKGRVLDIGCGGNLPTALQGLAGHYGTIDGIDPDPAIAMHPLLNRRWNSPFEASTLPEGNYDLAYAYNVLEHIADPVGFLRKVRAAYPNARALILTVPARKELWSNYDEHFGHFRRYTVETLAEELRASGFETIRSRYFFRALYPVMWGMRGHRTTTTRAPGNVALHRFMADCFIAEDRLLPGSIPGTSVIGQAW